MDYQPILNQIREQYQDILGEKLVGIFVHGSIACGCFNWTESDIDYLVVVSEPLTDFEKQRLMKATLRLNKQAPPKGLEMSVVLEKYCGAEYVFPTPYELHYSNMHAEWLRRDPEDYVRRMNGFDGDLTAHFVNIRHNGIVLCGKPVDEVFAPVEDKYFVESLRADLTEAPKEIFENTVYIVLNLCRALAFIKEGLLLSKLDGGNWALDNLPARFHELIRAALKVYTTGDDDEELEIEANVAIRFCGYAMSRILRQEDEPLDEFTGGEDDEFNVEDPWLL